jgi:hypothetical protein
MATAVRSDRTPGLHRAGPDRRRAGPHDRLDRWGVRDRLARHLPPRQIDRGARRRVELPAEDVDARGVLLIGRLVVAGQPEEPDEQRLVVLVERVHRHGAHRVRPGRVERAVRHRAERSLVQDRLRGRGDPSPLGQQPRLERRGTAHGKPVQQLPAEPGKADGRRPRAMGNERDIDDRAGRQSQDQRVAVQRTVHAEPTPDLRQAPPQCTQRIVSVREQQRRELAAGGRAVAQNEVRQDRPALAAADWYALPSVGSSRGRPRR